MNTPQDKESFIAGFFELASDGGMGVIIGAVPLLIVVSSCLAGWDDLFIDKALGVKIGALRIEELPLLWVKGGMIWIFSLPYLPLTRASVEGELLGRNNVVTHASGRLAPSECSR